VKELRRRKHMPLTAKQLTDLVTETIKAKQNLEKVLDFVDLMNNHLEEFPDEVRTSGEKIKEVAPDIETSIKTIKFHIDNELNKLPVDIDQAKDAAKKLMLYQGDIFQVINWAELQKRNYEENSYWWRYWQAVDEHLREQVEKERTAKNPLR
jgi:hypothetical protein